MQRSVHPYLPLEGALPKDYLVRMGSGRGVGDVRVPALGARLLSSGLHDGRKRERVGVGALQLHVLRPGGLVGGLC